MFFPVRRNLHAARPSITTPPMQSIRLNSTSSAFANSTFRNALHSNYRRDQPCRPSFSLNAAGKNTRLSRIAVQNLLTSNSCTTPHAPIQLCSRRCVHNDCCHEQLQQELDRLQKQEVDQLTDLTHEQLFGGDDLDVLVRDDKDCEQYETFLRTVDILCSSLSGKKHRSASSSPSEITSSASGGSNKSTSESADRKLKLKQLQQQYLQGHEQKYLRMISRELAKWIQKNRYCPVLKFVIFYQNKLPRELGIEMCTLKFWSPWMQCFEESNFDIYLSNTIAKVIKKALDSIKFPMTIAAMDTRFKQMGHIDSMVVAFSSALAMKDDIDSLHSRSLRLEELFVPRNITLQSDEVSIVCGSSGSGNTVTALAAASKNPRDVVFYTVVRESSEWDVLRARWSGETAMIRNKIVKDWVMEQIDKILAETHQPLLIDASGSDFNIVIIVDQIDICNGFFFGLRASLADLSIALHNKFFLPSIDPKQKKGWYQQCRIRFVAVGTGASDPRF